MYYPYILTHCATEFFSFMILVFELFFFNLFAITYYIIIWIYVLCMVMNKLHTVLVAVLNTMLLL